MKAITALLCLVVLRWMLDCCLPMLMKINPKLRRYIFRSYLHAYLLGCRSK